ncbi:DUF2806 domain-containing protein [Rugamonas rivuli]|uniref:DUF2806 domain-containing protein n=1 Tax=Rugamonas rivuli TaxID=2743358 RepID=A0A843S752_9BURK|nr:DUF2806 domain-containing protein [Rugamonas rivuli]MQA18091.1 DUF2806 domain-containing protein [Rugamonas rivuli]
MTEPESTVMAMVTEAVTSLPEPVKTTLFKALSNLLGGLTAIPAAKLKQYVKSIEDTTSARSMIAAAVAKTAAAEAINDPVLIQAATEIYLPTNLRKAKNRLNVAQSAVKRLEETTSAGADDETRPLDDDWMNSFSRFAEDASSERLQDLFGRILAGEVVRPGSFGLATLRAISELDQTIANDFSLAWAKSVGAAVDYSAEWKRGEYFSRWKRLSEAGFMAPTEISQFSPDVHPVVGEQSLWTPMRAGNVWLLVYFHQSSSQWNHIEFTRVGREIGSLLDRPDYEANIRQATNNLSRSGLTRIELHCLGKPEEVIWTAES